MTRPYDCWNCDHFLHTDPLTLLSGRCTRKAPKALSANGTPSEIFYNAGIVSDFLLSGPGLISVIARGGDITGKHLVWFEDIEGMNDNDSYPWVIPGGYRLSKLVVAFSRANSGAATVGANPVFNVNVAQVNGTTMTTLGTVPVPLPAASVGIFDNATDNYVTAEFDLPSPIAIGMGLWGLRIDLTTGLDENIIAQVRNPMIGAMVTRDPNTPLTNDVSLSKYALVSNGTISRCGDFKPAVESVPEIPEVTP